MKHLITIPFALATFTTAAFAGDPKGAPPAPPKDKAAGVAEAPKAEAPKPPQELADMAKGMTGSWKCSGTANMGGKDLEIKGTITHKPDLDNYWIATSLSATSGKMTFKFNSYTTYDATTKRWYRMMANSHGGSVIATGTLTGTKMQWEGDGRWNGVTVKVRDSEEMVSPKEVHVVGEASKDGGKTWDKDHDVTCKK